MSNSLDQPTDTRARLISQFRGDPSTHGQKWDELYKEGFLPWDKGFPNPALVDLLSERQDLLDSSILSNGGSRKKALVPGCGKGYDVLLLSAFGYDAYGLEISETALLAAKEVEKEMGGKGLYKAGEGVQRGKVEWLAGDFFQDEFLRSVEGKGVFDLIYDYTFLSALPPSTRPAWSKRLTQLLSPEGRLVCIEFPTYKLPSTGGPPWALPPKVYTGHLARPGQEVSYSKDGDISEEQLGEPAADGLLQIAHFQPKRTHQIGYNAEGKVTDWIGVWSHTNASKS